MRTISATLKLLILLAITTTAVAEDKKIVFIAGPRSHGFGSHEHKAGCMLLEKSLKESGLKGFTTEVVTNGWPKDESVLEGADCIVMYTDGGGRHFANPNLPKIDKLAGEGAGIVCIHYGVEVPKGESGDRFLNWIGGYFETHWSVNPHWTAEFEKLADHPITRGVKPFTIRDEWYYHMRFRPEMKNVTPILSDLPPDESLSRRDGAHSGNPAVRKAVLEDKQPQHVAWAAEREDGGRGFGFTGGHFHWNWGNNDFRKLVCNAIIWAAKVEVPDSGVPMKNLSVDDLLANQDGKAPDNFDREKMKAQLEAWNGSAGDSNKTSSRTKAKPIYKSPLVTSATEGHAVEVAADISGAKKLYLVVNDGGNGYSCDWADWAEPRLIGDAGEKKLTDLKWRAASSQWGQVRVNQNAGGKAMSIDGEPVAYGVGTHANSTIEYDLPEGYTQFKARGGLDNGGTDQGACGESASVQFLVYTQHPPVVVASGALAAAGEVHDAENAVAQLDVHEDLEATLFASEPMMTNPSNIEIDHRGRAWVCEIVNYRRHQNKRPEGDRIVILEDTNGDGKADKETVFHQAPDFKSPHGICVLPTVSGKGTKAIVSYGDKVVVMTDADGDDKADKQEVLFSGIAGTQHDHGIHAFVFGPDGKLYFNFGNSGRHLKDKDGKVVVDKAGNEIVANRKPYQEGMVFRCNMDGSEVETLGWNFRNNWEVTVDSYGALWQSDNDDDGNRGVRINFVMEFGNYGYKDELTGAGWKSKRTNLEKEVPLQHWHLNDPGVMPNLLQTGAGSPTGITVYEGDLLPEVFQGQVIHTDAGPNICRAYPAKPDGAGYSAEIVNILDGKRNKWFRPSDVAVATDGSLIVADWYDPGVGGHNAGDLDRGRLFRVTPAGQGEKYAPPKFDFSAAEGCVEALKNANYAVRYIAWTSLHEMGEKAYAALQALAKDDNPIYRARALWLLGKAEGGGQKAVNQALADTDPEIRAMGIRLGRQLVAADAKIDAAAMLKQTAADKSPAVRRECAVAIADLQPDNAPQLWAQLAMQHDGKDRWYLEALGIAARGNWDACLAVYLEEVGEDDAVKTAAGRDIIWRSRAKGSPALLAKILKAEDTAEEAKPRYFRAFDFLSGPEKDEALKSLLGL